MDNNDNKSGNELPINNSNERRNILLDTLIQATDLLLSADENDDFEFAVKKSIELIGHSHDADRVHIWRRDNINGEYLFIHMYMWISDYAESKALVPPGIMTPFVKMEQWDVMFHENKQISGAVSSLSPEESEYFSSFDVKSIIVVPIHINKQFWGLISVDDCQKERDFSDDEINVLQSVSLMIASLINKRSFSQILNDANERMMLMLDSSPLCAQIWSRDLSTIDCNEAGVKLYGFKDKQEYKDRFITSCSPEFQPDGQRSDAKAVALVEKAFNEGYCAFDWMHKMPDDDVLIPAEVTLVRAKYKDDDVVIGYTRDMREQHQLMEDIKLRDNMLKIVSEAERKAVTFSEYTSMLSNTLSEITKSPNIPAGDIKAAAEIIAKEGCNVLNVHRISIWSLSEAGDKLNNITCYERLTGKYSVRDDFDLLSRPYYTDLLNTERLITTNNVEESLILDDGYNPNLCAMLEAPVRIDGKLTGLVCADLDRCFEYPDKREWLSEEMNFVSSLADLMALAVSGYERRKARDDAEKASKAKSSFLANTSHEIRTPMNAILGITEIMMQSKTRSDEDKDDLSRIYSSGVMLLGIINDILDLSKIEADKFEITSSKYTMASLINDTTQLNMIRIGSKHIDFILDISDNVPFELIGDELRIKQILNNLLSNAFKYTETGTVSLSITTKQEPGSDHIFLIFNVSDTGSGMSPDQLDALFEEYSRFNNDLNENIEGVGLGLAITHRLVNLMNGEIDVSSEPGFGSVFTVCLPQQPFDDKVLSKEVIESLREFSYRNDLRSERRTLIRDLMPYGSVLVVDDFDSNLHVAQGILRMYGLQIDTSVSGHSAVNKIKNNNVYDVIFMDHMMPGMDGIEATKQIREHGYTGPIIALTANAIVGQAEMFLSNGFDGFLSKPIDIRKLTEILNKFVRDKQPKEVLNAVRYNSDSEDDGLEYLSDDVFASNNPVRNLLKNKKIDGLDISAGLERYNAGDHQYIGILRSYMASIRSAVNSVENVSENNLQDYKIVVHGIKGASLDIFAVPLGELFSDLETAANNNDFDFITQHNTAALAAARKMINDLNDLLSEADSLTEKPGRDRIDNDLLSSLYNACVIYDMDEIDNIILEINKFNYTYDNELADSLRESADIMNYSKMTEIISALERGIG